MSMGSLVFLTLLQLQRAELPASVDGFVVDSVTKQPLAGVTIQLQELNDLAAKVITVTRNDGTFVVRGIPPGGYVIEASRAGYVSEMLGDAPAIPGSFNFNSLAPPNVPIIQELKPGQILSGMRIVMTPGGVITGRLTDEHGEVVIGAVVQAFKTTYKNGLRERTLVQSVVSNDLGEYRFFMLKPGQYSISVIPTMLSLQIPVFHPGTIDVNAATVMDLQVGQTIEGMNFLAMPTKNRRITGGVEGMGSDGVTIVLSPLNGGTSKKLSIQSDSREKTFQFTDIVPGTYMIVASNVYGRTAIPLDVRNADLLGLRIFLGANYKIPTHVRIEDHPTGEDPALESVYFNVRLDVPVEGVENQVYSPFADGRLTLDVLQRDYWIEIMNREAYYVKSITLDGFDVLNQGLHVMGSVEGPMEIVVDNLFGELQGSAAAANSTVVLVPDEARRNQRPLYKSMKATGSTFHFEKVPPGDYKLFAWSEDTIENGGPWLDREYLRNYEDRATPVRIEPGTKTIVDRPIAAF